MSELIGRIQIVWDGLNPRERILVGLAGAGLVLAILFFGLIVPVQSAKTEATESAVTAERELVMTQRMKREWDGLADRLAEVEARIRGDNQRQNLLTLLETLAANAGVKPTSMEKRQSGESADYEETKVEVSLKNVTLKQAVDYLSSIERAAQPLSVKSLRVKRRPTRVSKTDSPSADLIDVTFSVSAFKPIS